MAREGQLESMTNTSICVQFFSSRQQCDGWNCKMSDVQDYENSKPAMIHNYLLRPTLHTMKLFDFKLRKSETKCCQKEELILRFVAAQEANLL